MKKTPLEIIRKREIALPKRGFSRAMRILLNFLQSRSDVTYRYSFDKQEMKGKQVILLADHAAREAYKYVLHGYPFANPNIVIGYQNIFVKYLFKIFIKAGVIPKKLYQKDPKAIIDMLMVLRRGGSLCIFPEGIQSASGSNHPIFAGTADLIKKAGVPVVLCKSYGSYLVKPRYKKKENKGHQEFHYELLFTKEELAELSSEEIYEKLLERFRYNDFEWNKIHRYKYRGRKKDPLARGIESILYYCPKCKSEFKLKTEGENIICEECKNTVILNEYYDLIPKTESDYMPYSNPDEWFKHQRELVREEVKSEFSYEYDCFMYDIHTEKLSTKPFYQCGEGKITINNNGIRYLGTRHGENLDLFIDIKDAPSFVFTSGQDNDIYYHNTYYSIRPKSNKQKVTKYMLLVEEAHRLTDPLWDKISEDAYGK